jgi:hypothetical protein
VVLMVVVGDEEDFLKKFQQLKYEIFYGCRW